MVIPCYNYGAYLPQAVRSALEQAGVEVDVIIVDDCSTDGSQKVALKLAEDDRRIRVILQNPNQGHIQTYNSGLGEAGGEFVVLLSADDLLAPGCLARATSLMMAYPAVGLVYGYAPTFGQVPPPMPAVKETWTVFSGHDWIRRMCRRGHNIIVNPEAVMRSSIMRSLDGYREDLPQSADMELWVRAAAVADVGRVNGPAQGFYRVHGQNMHSTDYAGVVREFEARRQVFDGIALLEQLPYKLRRRMVNMSRRKLACEALNEAKHGYLDEASASLVVQPLVDFARSSNAQIKRSPAWLLLVLRRSRKLPGWVGKTEDWIYRLRWKLRWRRWRRVGI